MQSTFSGIEIGKRSLFAHNLGLSTIGHNLSNASTEGYSRQRIQLEATDPIYRPQLNRAELPGQIGQGVDVASIERIRDRLLEGRIVSQANGEGYWETRDSYILMLEQIYNEPEDTSVRHLMDRFWDGWQELSLHPDQMAPRRALLQRGHALAEGLQLRYQSLDRVRDMLDQDVRATVKQINEHIREIADLNIEIVKVQAAGDKPNDLLDRRDLLVERLSGLVNITIDDRDPDEFNVHTSGFHIVQGGIARPFETMPEPENEGYSRVVWSYSREEAEFRGGKVFSLLELRDVDVRREIQKLDNLAVNFTNLVNEVHSAGYGLNESTGNRFFVERPFVINALGNYDRNGDGGFDSTYLFRVTGANALQAEAQIGIAGTMTLAGPDGRTTVEYFPTDTVRDVLDRINNSSAEVVARLDRNGQLSLKGTPASNTENPDFVLRYMEDSGQFLVGYAGILPGTGAENAYNWDQANAALVFPTNQTTFEVAPIMHPAGWIAVNPDIAEEPASIVASYGVGDRPGRPGDGRAALDIAALRNQSVMVGQIQTFDDYFSETVAEIGLKGEEAELALRTQNAIMKDLRDTRASISGVNIDEELAQMIKFQHGYNAAARFVTQVDRMLDTIINRMGV
jgi:flagellar hook-associated protein 1